MGGGALPSRPLVPLKATRDKHRDRPSASPCVHVDGDGGSSSSCSGHSSSCKSGNRGRIAHRQRRRNNSSTSQLPIHTLAFLAPTEPEHVWDVLVSYGSNITWTPGSSGPGWPLKLSHHQTVVLSTMSSASKREAKQCPKPNLLAGIPFKSGIRALVTTGRQLESPYFWRHRFERGRFRAEIGPHSIHAAAMCPRGPNLPLLEPTLPRQGPHVDVFGRPNLARFRAKRGPDSSHVGRCRPMWASPN